MWRGSGARFSLGWILDAVRTTDGSVYRRLVPRARLDTARDSSENRVTDTCMQGYAGGRFGQEVDEQRRGSQESTASRTPAVKGRWSFRPNSRRFWRMAIVVARHGSLQCKSLQALVTPFWSLSACSARARRHSVQTDWGLVALMSNLRLKSPKRVA